MKQKNLIPLAAMEKLIKNSGAERVSENAKKMLYRILIEKSEEISKKSILFANHAGRQTIKAKDISAAKK